MVNKKRLLLSVLAILVLVSALMPMAALAEGRKKDAASRTFSRTFVVPANAEKATRFNLGRLLMVVPAGALPEGGEITVSGEIWSDGKFVIDFTPDYVFEVPVLVKFGNAKVVYWHDGDNLVPIKTRGGWVKLEHFSRYSGWH